jgi:cytochrome P450
MFLLISAFGIWFLRRWTHFSKWDHIPGHKAISSFPMLGHAYNILDTPVEKLIAHRKKYGDIFRLDSGPIPTVWFNDYDTISKVFKQDHTAGRPHNHIPANHVMWKSNEEGEIYGLALSQKSIWSEQRKFVGGHLSSRKQLINDVVTDEAKIFTDELAKVISDQGNCVEVNGLFLELVNRVLWRMFMGKTIERGPKLDMLKEKIRDTFRTAERSRVLHILQVYNYWAIELCKHLKWESILDIVNPIRDYLGKEVQAGTPDKESDSMIDRYLANQENAKKDSSFYGRTGIENLTTTLLDLILGGTDTVSAYLEWLVLYLIKFPEMQERMFSEIEAAVGTRAANVEDRPAFHYLESAMLEIMRHCPHMALTIQHMSLDNMTVNGYFIPKNTQIYYHSGAVHNDEKLFPEASTFKPDRFLTPEGKFQNDEHVIYFGIGKRRCVGEILGRAETFLFTLGLVQAFKFEAMPGAEYPDLKYRPGLNMHVLPLHAKITPRY